MSLIKNLFGKQTLDNGLLGSWASDLTDEVTKNSIGDVTMTFTADGKLIYEIKAEGKIQVINMTYRTKDGTIISDQPSTPRKEITKYNIENSNILILDYNKQFARFIKT